MQMSSSSSLVPHLTNVFRVQSTLETSEVQQFLSAATRTSATTRPALVRCPFPAPSSSQGIKYEIPFIEIQ